MTEVLPRPKALDAVVYADIGARVLHCRLPEHASGYARLLWRAAWQALRRSQEAGWPIDGAPWVWADTPTASRVVHGEAGEWNTLVFRFPPGAAGYTELVGRPGLVAIAVLDLNSHRFLNVKFLNRG